MPPTFLKKKFINESYICIAICSETHDTELYLFYCRSDENGIATDPNSIKVGGDIKMDLDLNEAIKEDAKLQEASE